MGVISVDRKLKGVEKIVNSLLNWKIICVSKHLATVIQIAYLQICRTATWLHHLTNENPTQFFTILPQDYGGES